MSFTGFSEFWWKRYKYVSVPSCLPPLHLIAGVLGLPAENVILCSLVKWILMGPVSTNYGCESNNSEIKIMTVSFRINHFCQWWDGHVPDLFWCMMAHHDLLTKWSYAGLLVIGNFTRTVVVYRGRQLATTDNSCDGEIPDRWQSGCKQILSYYLFHLIQKR